MHVFHFVNASCILPLSIYPFNYFVGILVTMVKPESYRSAQVEGGDAGASAANQNSITSGSDGSDEDEFEEEEDEEDDEDEEDAISGFIRDMTLMATDRGDRGISPLFLAIRENHKDCVRALLRAGCSLDVMAEAAGKQYVGPFEYALIRGYVDISKMLLACGITKNVMNPLMLSDAFENLLDRETEEEVEEAVELVDWIIDQLKDPPSLQLLCRKAIRGHMGIRVLGGVLELPLPQKMINYLALSELNDY